MERRGAGWWWWWWLMLAAGGLLRQQRRARQAGRPPMGAALTQFMLRSITWRPASPAPVITLLYTLTSLRLSEIHFPNTYIAFTM